MRAILLDPEARGDVKTGSDLRPAAPAGAVHRQRPARVRRALGGRQRTERRLPESARARRWAGPLLAAVGVQLLPARLPWCPARPVSRGPEFGILLDLDGARPRATSSTRMVFSRIAVGANAPARHLARLHAAAGRWPAIRRDSSTGSTRCCCTARCPCDARAASSHAVTAVPATNTLKRARTAAYLVAHVVAVSGGAIAMTDDPTGVPAADRRRASATRSAPRRSSPASSGSG